MGSYSGTITRDDKIHVKDPEILARGIEEIFRQGGMMDVSGAQFFGKTFHLLTPIKYNECERLVVFYNYFENSCWENAGFDRKKGALWSNKVGYKHFCIVITAAYIYESLLHDGVSCAYYNDMYWFSSNMIGWINYVLHTELLNKTLDPWPLFELLRLKDPKELEKQDWEEYRGRTVISSLGYLEVQAVMKSTEEALKEVDDIVSGLYPGNDIMHPLMFLEKAKIAVSKYRRQSSGTEEEQVKALLQAVISCLEKNAVQDDIESPLKNLQILLLLCDSPAFIVKSIAEEYNQDFWELWGNISDIWSHGDSDMWPQFYYSAEPVTTEELLQLTGDDRIFWWTEENPVIFSPELQNWFKLLREKYQNILSAGCPDFSFADLVTLLELAEIKCRCVVAFDVFFIESVEHLRDQRYIALWKLQDLLVHGDEFQEKSLNLLLPIESNQSNQDEYEIKRIKMRTEMVRRFHALAANVALRKTVFGF